jgi:hypothetical protein
MQIYLDTRGRILVDIVIHSGQLTRNQFGHIRPLISIKWVQYLDHDLDIWVDLNEGE